MVEALLADGLRRRGVAATVHSAGLLFDGQAADPHTVTAMADRELDLSGHASRRMTEELLRAADLVIGMERRHVREAAVLAPGSWPKAFTLKELARRATEAGPRPPDVPVDQWLARLSAERTTSDHLGDDELDDVPDPIGRGLRAFRRCADDLADLVEVVVAHLWPAGAAAGDLPSPDAVRSTTP